MKDSSQQFDQLHRFLFDEHSVRGELVRIQQSYGEILAGHDYPQVIQYLLGELMAATSLLSATLKFEGEISLQVQGEGKLKYAVINGTHEQALRGVARWDGDVSHCEFFDLFHKGVLAITITPKEGERYQGIVAIDKPSLAECIESYFEQSEQLKTKVILGSDPTQNSPFAWGFLLQVLPHKTFDEKIFEHLAVLADTLSVEEVANSSVEELLYRLYHQEQVELFDPTDVKFECGCSKVRSAIALKNVDKQSLLNIAKEEGEVVMDCQYCSKQYRFDSIDIEAIHAGTFAGTFDIQNQYQS